MKAGSEEALNDLAFKGRNKAYGAYFLRKKYPTYLGISFLSGILILMIVVLAPFFYYYFEPLPLEEGDIMYDIEYDGMMAPPDEDLTRLARAFSIPPKEIEQVPIVVDSLKPEKQVVVKEIADPQEKNDDPDPPDTLAKPAGSGMGSGETDETELATTIDVFPRFPGGDEARLYYLRQHIRYPEKALKNKIQGVVVVVFIIETDGSLSNIDVSNRIGGGCEEEAIRVTREMPKWESGKRNGRNVRVMVRMPIVFRIPGKQN